MKFALPTDRVTFDSSYGLELEVTTPDLVKARCAVADKVRQPFGLVHGGVLASIAEALSSIGTSLGVADGGEIGVGQNNNTSFLRPIFEGYIHAEARPRHRGRATWIWDVEITDDAGNLCAISRVTIAVRPAERD
ncbi:MAG: PaaI family thioesterase [Candidatus Dormibacteraeota bacterium]|nr:PaaI family thioesterase [Candidatus Dormibacteraeota bacterium]